MTFKLLGNDVFDSGNSSNFNTVYLSNVKIDDGFPGGTAGYASGGWQPPNSETSYIEKFPFATTVTNASYVASLSSVTSRASGHSSTSHGYTTGGGTQSSPPYQSFSYNKLDKFPFANNSSATDIGDLAASRKLHAGQSSSTSGYVTGGYRNSTLSPVGTNTIEKFPFSTDTNASNIGNLSGSVLWNVGGQSSLTHGYTSGGSIANTIDKFPFSTDTNAAFVAYLSSSREIHATQSSLTNGYTGGGGPGGPPTNVIDKFPFATDANATNIGNLTQVRTNASGQSSTSHGYTTGGYEYTNFPTWRNTIDRFPFSTDSGATDVGDLTAAGNLGRGGTAGQQD